MKKEVAIAIIIGLVLGVIITFGLYRARLSLVEQPINPTPSPTIENQLDATSTLNLDSPKDESIVSDKNVTIAGSTLPHAFVVIFVNDEEQLTNADDTGHFSVTADLETGSNVIAVHSLDEDGKAIVQERVVIYSTTGFDEVPVSTSSGEKK